MRIKYITNVRLPSGRAAGYAIIKMCSEFAHAGIETQLIVPERSNTDLKEDPFDYYKLERNFEIKKVNSFDLLGTTLRFGKIFYWVDVVSFLIQAKRKVVLDKGDVLYTRDFITTLFFSKKESLCLELHAVPRSTFLFKLAIKRVKRFVVLTQSIKNILVRLGVPSDHILVSPSGVDVRDLENSLNDVHIEGVVKSDFVFGYIGTLKTMGMEKGVAICLEALALMPKGYTFLVVGGDGEDIKYYTKMATRLCVTSRVVFIGEVPHSEIYKYSKRCNVLVAPFPDNPHYSYYMSPLKIFEYMASKRPIIATNLPSLREVLRSGENAVLIPPNNPEALVDALACLKESPEYSRKIAEKAYLDVIEKYTWAKRVNDIILFIQT